MMEAALWHAHARATSPQPDPVDLAVLARQPAEVAAAYVESVLRWVGNLYLDVDQARGLTAAMDAVIEANTYTPPGAKTLIGLTAPNTAGKSTLVRRWARDRYRTHLTAAEVEAEDLPEWHPSRDMAADRIPIVWINLQAGAARKEFNAQFLHFCGYQGEGVLRATSERVASAIAAHGVRLVIVDDVHLLRTQHRDGQTVLDHLKFINTVLGEHHATLVLVGANLPGGDLLADPQIRGRLRLLELPTFPIDSAADKLAWQNLLKTAETQLSPYLPHAEPGFLATRAGLIWRRTQGYLGDVGALLRYAAHTGIRAGVTTPTGTDPDECPGAWTITTDHLTAAPLSERACAAEADLAARRDRSRTRQRKAG